MIYALGTVQFGMKYGIANNGEETPLKEISSILEFCRKSGIDTIDTALGYGSSQLKLGLSSVEDFKVITKIPPLKEDTLDISNILRKNLYESLEELKLDSIYGLLMHKPSDFLAKNNKYLINTLNKFKEEGLVKKIGCSIYDPSDLSYLINLLDLDMVQAPLNVFDRRLLESGWLLKLKENNIEVHVRSCFLQGLLLMSKEQLPPKFKHSEKLFKKWFEFLNKNNISQLSACLSFVNSCKGIDRILVGVQTKKQLEEIINVEIKNINKSQIENLSSNNLDLIDPSRWK